MQRILICVGLLALLAGRAKGQVVAEMTPEKIKEAITRGSAHSRRGGVEGCYALLKGGVWFGKTPIGCFSTPYSRVVAAAVSAKKKYKEITEADITSELIAAGELHIHAFAQPIEGSPDIANVEAIVIMPRKSKDRSKAIQPTKVEETTAEFKNLMGASLQGKSMSAVFPLSVLSEQNEVRIVYDRTLGKPAWCDDCAIEFELKKRPVR